MTINIQAAKQFIKSWNDDITSYAMTLLRELDAYQRIVEEKEKLSNEAREGYVLVEVKIPEGYELAYKEMRHPQVGESYLSTTISGQDVKICNEDAILGHRVIVKKKWQWPEWLTCNYIAMDLNGDWYGYTNKPILSLEDKMWSNNTNLARNISSYNFINFNWPTVVDWTQSLMENPHKKGSK